MVNELTMNLFDVCIDYKLAHCISADFEMGKGIAVEFVRRYNMRNRLLDEYGFCKLKDLPSKCLYVKIHDIKDDEFGIFNLVTKERYWAKPNYLTLSNSLQDMKSIALSKGFKKIAMPAIGCGLDKLSWPSVKDIICNIFYDTDIEILVCHAP